MHSPALVILLSHVVPLEDEVLRANLDQLVGSGLLNARGNPPDATYTKSR